MNTQRPVRIANVSGFYGDRPQAMREMLQGGGIDYLTGDYLAELTMLILAKDKLKDPSAGWARTFVHQLRDSLADIAAQGARVVANAGGLNPAGLAATIRELVAEQGLDLTVGYVDGDDLMDHADELGFGDAVSANAYLGAFGIVECLDAGADIVVTGRVTDASVIVGPAAHHFGWGREDLDQLAGAVAAGHVIECGAQATGGNYAWFNRGDIADPVNPGFPIAEIAADGTAVITKQPGTGGAVTAGTVTAQLLYEVTGARYPGPDCTLRLDHVRVADLGDDRVAVTGAVGEPPPPTTKVSVNRIGGYRNEFTVHLTGLDVEDKAALFRRQMEAQFDGDGPAAPSAVDYRLERTDHPDADTQAAATARLTCVAWDEDPAVAAGWARAAVAIGLGSFPGAFFDGPPPKGSAYGVYRAEHVPNDVPRHRAHLPDGTVVDVPPPPVTAPVGEPFTDLELPAPPAAGAATRRVPLGAIAAARSGDKGGDANIGVWVDDPAAYPWLLAELTPDRVRELLPETADLDVECLPLPRLNAVNVLVRGLLGHGVAHGVRFDPQAKGLGEWLRSRHVDVPVALLDGAAAAGQGPGDPRTTDDKEPHR